MNDLIALAESAAVPPLAALKDDALEFWFGSGEDENSLATGTRSSDIRTAPDIVVAFISRAYESGRHYTVFCYSDLRLNFSCEASDVLVREKETTLGTLPRFQPGSWSYESNELSFTFKNIFLSLNKAEISFHNGSSFKIRHGDGCLLSKDLNDYLLSKGSRAKKMTLALILYARFFRASM